MSKDLCQRIASPGFQRARLIDVALGREPSDLVITGATIVDVNVRKLRRADIAIKDSRIALVGDVTHTIGPSTKRVDAASKIISPGLIDAHMHVEAALVTAYALAEAALPRGNTTLIAEPHDLADCFGLRGVELLRQEAAYLPLRLYIMAPNPVPLSGPELGTTPGSIGPAEVQTMMQWPEVLGLGKVQMPPVLGKDPEQLAKLAIVQAARKPLGGRSNSRQGREIQAMVAAGIGDDYSARTAECMLEWLEAGLKIIVSEGSTVPHVHLLAALIREQEIDPRHCLLCTYDRTPDDVRRRGMVDEAVRVLIAEGIDPVLAIQMATLNSAEHFGLAGDLGSITPGRLADLLIIEDLPSFRVGSVYVGGQLVALDGRVVSPPEPFSYPAWVESSVTLPAGFGAGALRYPAPFAEGRVTVRAIGLVPNVWAHDLTRELRVELPVRRGEILPDPASDLLKLVAIERFGLSGAIGRGFIQGLGFKKGAIAVSVAHDYHCILAAGTSDEEIAFAARRLAEVGGGFVVVADSQVCAELQLEIGGLMTRRSLDEAADALARLDAAARQLGFGLPLPEPLPIALTFLSLPGCPGLRLSDQGYIGPLDPLGSTRGIVPLVVDGHSGQEM